jgi:hypothetical protein
VRPIPRRRFRRAVRRLDAGALAAFVADTWTARGATARREGRRVVVERPRGRLTVVVHDGTGPFGRGRLSRPPAPADVDADRVVTTVDVDAPGVVDPDDLYRRALYGLPSAAADDCCRRHLGIPARHDPDPTPPATRAAVALVGVLVLAVVAGTAFAGDRSTRLPVAEPPRSAADPAATATPQLTPASLGTAHAATLRETGYAFRTERTVRNADGGLRSRVATAGCISRDRRTFTVAITVEGPEAVLFADRLRNETTVAFHADDDLLVRATATGRVTTVERVPPEAYDTTERFFILPDPRDPGEALRGVRLRTAERGGVDRVEGVLFENVTVFARAHGVTAPRNLSAGAAVDDGLVRGYRLSYDATFVDRRISVDRSGRFRRTTTAPDRPAWTTDRGPFEATPETIRRSVAAACAPED